jgi:hypothetical protein
VLFCLMDDLSLYRYDINESLFLSRHMVNLTNLLTKKSVKTFTHTIINWPQVKFFIYPFVYSLLQFFIVQGKLLNS